jgi:uncharacterized membrane protein SpoIIM required for sporulation
MQADQLYESRQADWKRLTELLDRSQQDIRRLSPQDVESLGRLYRAATSDLALAQRDFPGHRVTTYLNQLVARGHAVIYRSEPLALNRLFHFATAGFPQVFRETAIFSLIAALFFTIPAVAAGLGTAWQPETARWLLPVSAHHLIPAIEKQELWVDIPVKERPYASSFIMQNNIRVSFLAFGSGILGGIFTVWIMIFNGLLLGGLTGLTAYHDVAFELWTFVIGHGVIELNVIFIAGGSGLMLGWTVLQPGLLRRRDALVFAAHKAVRLIMGCVPLLVLAGLIEGFISPADYIPWPVKWGLGLASGLLLYAYLGLAGRGQAGRPTTGFVPSTPNSD